MGENSIENDSAFTFAGGLLRIDRFSPKEAKSTLAGYNMVNLAIAIEIQQSSQLLATN